MLLNGTGIKGECNYRESVVWTHQVLGFSITRDRGLNGPRMRLKELRKHNDDLEVGYPTRPAIKKQ